MNSIYTAWQRQMQNIINGEENGEGRWKRDRDGGRWRGTEGRGRETAGREKPYGGERESFTRGKGEVLE
ncbi:hypothetical protein SESBI_37134 [Sesbania bispinosa]|nr:hypothetical protein SESBI_37134 [Sesbania bispinosa]